MMKFVTLRRVLWTVGLGFGAFFIGGMGYGIRGGLIGLAWGASIGYGFGTVFDQKRPTKWLVFGWAAILGFVGIFFELLIGAGALKCETDKELAAAGGGGSLVGALFGAAVGRGQSKRLHRLADSSSTGIVSMQKGGR